MLYAIHRGYVDGYEEGQDPLIHLVTTAQAADAGGCGWVFTDGHATMGFTEFFDDLTALNEVDWGVMGSRYWYDTPDYPDRKRRRQAEFLIKDRCPWELTTEIGVMNSRTKSLVKETLETCGHRPLVRVQKQWYY